MFCCVNSAFQDHTERMRKKLANQRQQQVDDEDDRIAKTVAERESKREVCPVRYVVFMYVVNRFLPH